MKKLLILTILTMCGFILTGCAGDKEEEYSFEETPNEFSYYEEMKVADKLYSFGTENGTAISNEMAMIGTSIQGIYAQTESIYYHNEPSNKNQYNHWLKDLENYGIKHEVITITEMIEKYILEYDNPSYIIYDDEKEESINVATTIAGLTQSIVVEKSLVPYIENFELTLELDASEKTQRWCFDQYKDQLNNNGVMQQRSSLIYQRDYAIACQYMTFYVGGNSLDDIKLRNDIHNWVKDDAPIFGWGPGHEDSHVGIASTQGQFTIPSDWARNMTVLAGNFGIETLTQPNEVEEIIPEEGKHYVSFIRSDGDNVQTWYNYFPFEQGDLAAERGEFKMGWSVQPSLIDLGQTVLKNAYDNADKNDSFVCAVSGHGYIYPQQYPELALRDFTSRLGMYLRKTDLSVVQILDGDMNDKVIEAYSKIPELTGGIYMYGDKYSGGKGSVCWSDNGKPFIAFRESLWDTNAEVVASRINGYEKDYTSIEGYTMVNLHPWSMDYNDIKDVVALLGEDVIIVSPDEFVNMVTKYVPKVDVIK